MGKFIISTHKVYSLTFVIFISLFLLSNIYAVDALDITKNHEYYKDVKYVAGNGILPLYVDNKFNLDMKLNKTEVLFASMVISGVSLDYKTQNPYFQDFDAKSKIYPYLQTAVEKGYIEVNAKQLTKNITVEQAINIMNKIFKKVEYNGGSGSDSVTRKIFINILNKTPGYKEMVAKYSEDIETFKEKQISKVLNSYVKGEDTSLDSLRLSTYQKENSKLEKIYFSILSDEESDYQQMYEDPSIESLDVLDEKVNKALLLFYEAKYWNVIKECNDVLKIKPDHVGALSLKGSAYYKLQDYAKAKKYWKKGALFEPENENILYFLSESESTVMDGERKSIRDISFENSSEILSYQKVKENEIQNLLDKLYGNDNAVIALQIKVISNTPQRIKHSLLLPGVPNIGDVKPNNRNEFIIDHYEVSLWVNYLLNKDEVLKRVKTWLNFNDKHKDTINVYTEKFVKDEKNNDLDIIKELIRSSEEKSEKIIESIKQKNEEDLNRSLRELEKAKSLNSTMVEKQSKIGQKEIVFYAILLFSSLILGGILFALMKISKSSNLSGAAGGSGSGAGGSGGGGGAGKDSKDSSKTGMGLGVDADKNLDDEITVKESQSARDYFEFVNESNILKLAYLIEKDMPKGEKGNAIYWQNVAVIISYLPSHLGNIILSKFKISEQAEILPYLVHETEYSSADISKLEQSYKEKVACLVGGKNIVKPILDKISNISKTELTVALSEKYPDILVEIRDMIILFDDILELSETDIITLFMEVDVNVIALSIIDNPKETRDRLIGYMPEGLQVMLNEVLDLRKGNVAKIEITNAQETIIKTAKILNHMGIIQMVQKQFNKNKIESDDKKIDELFQV
ncbi:MAG: FliG C-terminal domain-containing protein [Candidatus Margulisbacteria bacterium]|nr:FliG C-terminal domain-containing protein [Candidatus Margulisiibacteriota bacterium]